MHFNRSFNGLSNRGDHKKSAFFLNSLHWNFLPKNATCAASTVTLCICREDCWCVGDATTWIKISPTQTIRVKFVEKHFRT